MTHGWWMGGHPAYAAAGCGPQEAPTEKRRSCGHARFMGGHGPHGHGWGPGRFFEHFPGGPGGRGGRRARRGDVRAAVLALLAEEPMHGYQVMQELEERSKGVWRPSPGSVYPALQLLQDQGLVKAEDIEGRRVFSLTEEGRQEAERVAGETPPWQATGGTDDRHLRLRDSFFQLGAAVRQVGMTGGDETVDRALEILAEARRKLYGLLAEGE